MPSVPVSVRLTRTRRCKEGFYALVNGQRMRFKRRADAFRAIVDSVFEQPAWRAMKLADWQSLGLPNPATE